VTRLPSRTCKLWVCLKLDICASLVSHSLLKRQRSGPPNPLRSVYGKTFLHGRQAIFSRSSVKPISNRYLTRPAIHDLIAQIDNTILREARNDVRPIQWHYSWAPTMNKRRHLIDISQSPFEVPARSFLLQRRSWDLLYHYHGQLWPSDLGTLVQKQHAMSVATMVGVLPN
jgi:hypothetical protein